MSNKVNMKYKNNRRLRKSSKILLSIFASMFFLYSLFTFMKNIVISSENINTKEEIYSYKNMFKYDYEVNLVDNDYIDEKKLSMRESAYITELIDNIAFKFDYQYKAKEKSKIEYNYNIKSKLVGCYNTDGKEQNVWNKEYTLLDEIKSSVDSEGFSIIQDLKLDLKEENDLVKKFEQEMFMNIDAKYVISFNLNTYTEIDGRKVENNFSDTISIDLGNKTTSINGDNNIDKEEFITKEVAKSREVNKKEIIWGVLSFIIAIIIFRYISNSETSRNIRNEYRVELNKILRVCQDKIVQLSNKIEINQTNIVDVKEFGEIVKLSEELYKPILYWTSSDIDESWFCVMSNNVNYRYILKSKG